MQRTDEFKFKHAIVGSEGVMGGHSCGEGHLTLFWGPAVAHQGKWQGDPVRLQEALLLHSSKLGLLEAEDFNKTRLPPFLTSAAAGVPSPHL